MKVYFCVPVYNEGRILEANGRKLLDFLKAANFPFDWKLNFTVNGSTDDTLEIANKLALEYSPLVEVMVLGEGKRGKGLAVKSCWLGSDADILVYMDSDLAVSLEGTNPLVEAVTEGGFDMAIGSRLLPDSKINRSFWREFVSQSYIYFSRLVLGHRFSDLQCGFKAVKKEFFVKAAPLIISDGWFFDTELIMMIKSFGGRIKEVPVNWEENRYDQRKSKVKVFRDSVRFLLDTIGLKMRILKNKSLK
jgi:glycosyltransferase involved in cell wall biosynthesis